MVQYIIPLVIVIQPEFQDGLMCDFQNTLKMNF